MNERKAVTIKDVAAQLGVSTMTVSAVLSGKSKTVRISEATRARVLETARQMQYRPNATALSLRRRHTNVLGFYTRHGYLNGRSAFLSEIVGGLQAGCDEHHKDLLLHGAFHGHSVEEIYGELTDGRVDGLVLLTSPDDPLVPLLIASALPAVAVVDAVPGLPSVAADDVAGMGQLVRYLAGHGHHRLYYRDRCYPRVSAVRRLSAFRQTASALGLETVEGAAVDISDQMTPDESLWMVRPRDQRPTAAVCWNDMTAYDLLGQCQSRGLHAPEDLAVVGFDGVTPPAGFSGRLTTMRAPWADIAATAVDLLARRIAGEEILQETVLPVEFVQGDTA